MIHPLADIQSEHIGEGTRVWQFSVILKNAVIGSNCNINCHVFIENDVIIGNNVTVKSGVYLWDGLRIEDNVFIGPNVTFTNDKTPRSKQYPAEFQKTTIKRNASLGAGSIVLGGTEIGEFSMTGAGSLVTRDVPPRALVTGSPARITGWLNDDGSKMTPVLDYFLDSAGNKWKVEGNSLQKI
jgi:UDP-2-acetamido-3-amino-2,3-dideoxy-glucuronate N-acetyltransferase